MRSTHYRDPHAARHGRHHACMTRPWPVSSQTILLLPLYFIRCPQQHLGKRTAGQRRERARDQVAREVVDGPPAERPGHAHSIAAQQSDRGALGVLQQQR